jgi:adenylate cyclase, class 2
MFEAAGLRSNAYQENTRETWHKGNAEIVIDTWPGLEPYIEVEADTESVVQDIAEQLSYSWNDKIVTSIVEIYMEQYGLTEAEVLEKLVHITFVDNPFATMERKPNA